VKDSVTIGLLHLGVDVVARVSQLRDLFGKEFHAVDRVAEDDGLIDLELGEEGVEAVDFLTFFDVGVELSDTAEGEFVHEVDGVGVGDEFLAELLHSDRECSTKETDLMIFVTQTNDFLEDWLELC
jgi:hypothetical protein